MSIFDYYWELKIYADKIKELEEENRNLKNEIIGYKKIESKLNNVIKTLKEENKKLKEENKRLSDFLECEA